MRILITLLFSLLILTNNQIIRIPSPIDFINYLQRTGYYELFYIIKCQYGVNFAIEVCQYLISSPYCEEVIRVYIPQCDEEKVDYCSTRGREKFLNILYENVKIVDSKLKPEQISAKISDKLCGSNI